MNTSQGLGSLINNRYLIQEIIKQGKYESIYLVEDQARSSENFLLRQFIAREGGNKAVEVGELFKQQLNLLKILQHPQIQQLQDFFWQGKSLSIVQGYLEGTTYQDLLKNKSTFSESEAIYFLNQVLPVLIYLHNQGIVHDDICPSNIYLRHPDNLPILSNFGVISDIMNQMVIERTQTRIVDEIQTLSGVFIPPGVSRDLYTLAVTVIILLTGQEINILFNSQTQTWEWENWKVITDQLATVLNTMLSKRESDRFPSANAVLQALNFPLAAIPSAPIPIISTAAIPINTPFIPPTVVSYQPDSYAFQTTPTNNISSGLKDWHKALILGCAIGFFILVAILLTRKYSPQPVAQQLNNQVNISPPVTPSPSVNSTPVLNIQPSQQVISNNLTKMEAVNILNTYLQAKEKIFGPSFDREVAARVTTGAVYNDIVRPGGRLDSLKQENAYWRFGYRKAEPLAYFYANDNHAEIAVKVTEETYYYEGGIMKKKNNNIKDYKFILLKEDGVWKIADRESI